MDPVRTLQYPDGSVLVTSLSTCQAYWVTATAVSCASRIRSEAAFIGVNDPDQFEAVINLGSGGPCSKWLTINLEQKHRDAQKFVIEALNDACGYEVQCTANTTFLCQEEDDNKVDFV